MARSLRRPSAPTYVLVPVRQDAPGLPRVNYSVPDTSYFRMNQRTNKPNAIITVTPDGVELGWDNCGICAGSISGCTCPSGISIPNSISYIFVSRGGEKPTPPPLAVVFTPPAFKKKRSLRREIEQPRKPKRSLRRKKQESLDAQEAEKIMERSFRKLKRK